MKRYILLLLLMVWLAPATVLARGQNDALVIGAGQHVAGSVATIAQDIQVDGAVDGDVTSWSGSITIAGSVGGDVVSYSGDVTLMPTGRVGGHILASGGTLRRAPSARVTGQTIDGGAGEALASLIDLLNPTSDGRQDDPLARGLFGAALGVLLTAFCFLYTAFWPGRVALAGDALRRLPGRALSMGLLTTLALALALLPLAGLLVASVIGVPVLLGLLALALALYVYGLIVLGRALSASSPAKAQSAAQPANSRLMTITLAMVLLIGLAVALAPLWGLAMFFLVASPGLGAVILSRGGMALPVVARLR
jgi:cytoskeletal protein CcmA (bactofilin family)